MRWRLDETVMKSALLYFVCMHTQWRDTIKGLEGKKCTLKISPDTGETIDTMVFEWMGGSMSRQWRTLAQAV
jgi:hypothetical protein